MAEALAPAAWTGRGVRIAEVAERLQRLRQQAVGERLTTVTSVLNLVVWSRDPEREAEARATVDALADHHPSRTIVLVPAPGKDAIDARVEEVERVVLTLYGDVAAHAASAVAPLLRRELPTFLWWTGAPEVGSEALGGLLGVADRIVTDAGDVPGSQAIASLLSLVARGAAVTDFAWPAITPWRQALAQLLHGEPLVRLRAAPATARVEGRGLEGLLLAGWMRDVIGPGLRIEAVGGPSLESVTLAGPDGTLGIEREGQGTLAVTSPDGPRRSLPHPRRDRAALLAGELDLQRRDRPLERSLAAAARLL